MARLLIGINDLATTSPGLAAQAHGWDPTTVTAGSGQKRPWICDEGHTWTATINDRSNGHGCPYCAGRKVLAGYNDLATINPGLAAQASGWDPTTVPAGSNRNLSWICDDVHEWAARVVDRSRGDGCPYCAGKKVLAGYIDFATTNPDLSIQAHGWDPAMVTAMSGQKFSWICDEGHVWDARVADRSAGRGCPTCANKKALAGYNDLATTNPGLAAQAHGWDPTTVTAMSMKKLSWVCKEGHVWDATVAHRSNGRGCPYCAVRFFKPNLDAHLYLLEHPERDLCQIGVSNRIKRRLAEHAGKGWKVIGVSSVMPGDVAYQYEQDGRRAIKSRGGVFTDLLGNVKSRGYSEVWTRKSFRPKSLAKLMQMVDEDRSKVVA